MIPDYQTLMLPLLQFSSDGKEHKLTEAVDLLSNIFKLTDVERKQMLPSNTQDVMTNRVGWARTYMKKAGLLEDPKRGVFQITEKGKSVLSENPIKIDRKYLMKFEGFKEFQEQHRQKESAVIETESTIEATPEELLEEGYAKLSETLIDDILNKILGCSPSFFEHLVVDLLVKMGYGGSFQEASSVVGKSGDEGIDGIIKEDRLGLDAIYIQAKRWKDGIVGRPEIQKFVGALAGQKATKGVFITTSKFTRDAEDYAKTVSQKIVLIDGSKLASLMIEHNVGISIIRTYEIKRLDNDYFEE